MYNEPAWKLLARNWVGGPLPACPGGTPTEEGGKVEQGSHAAASKEEELSPLDSIGYKIE